MNNTCPICNKPKCENCKCMSNIQSSVNKQESTQVLIEDGTMSTFGLNNLSEVKIKK